MNKQIKLSIIMLLFGTFLFNLLFWKESFGLNVLIFDVFLFIAAVCSGFRPSRSALSLLLCFALFASSLAICWHSSVYSIVMHYITFLLFIGIIQQNELKSIIYTLNSSLASLFKLPGVIWQKVPKNKVIGLQKAFKIVRLSLIPFVFIWIFYLLFRYANPIFEKFSFRFFNRFFNFFSLFFQNFSFVHFFFILLGFGLTAWILFKTDMGYLLRSESMLNSNLIRKRKVLSDTQKSRLKKYQETSPEFFRERFSFSMKLKYEVISATVLLVLINILLLVVNSIDFRWVWLGFRYSENFDLKQFVHEGTYLLIVSILLSMGIMLYFFRKNLNFYPKAKFVKYLTYIWIAQNLFLTISVAVRNFRYIEYWGLAYKRIGVILFLLAVIYGLFTLFLKIRDKKTSYFLIRKNTLAVFIILLVSSLVNWDYIIARHNLRHPLKNHMETSYLLSMSDKVLPLIHSKNQVLDQDVKYNTYAYFYPYSYREYYSLRVRKFCMNYENKSWLSWNYSEWKAYRYYQDIFNKRLRNLDKSDSPNVPTYKKK